MLQACCAVALPQGLLLPVAAAAAGALSHSAGPPLAHLSAAVPTGLRNPVYHPEPQNTPTAPGSLARGTLPSSSTPRIHCTRGITTTSSPLPSLSSLRPPASGSTIRSLHSFSPLRLYHTHDNIHSRLPLGTFSPSVTPHLNAPLRAALRAASTVALPLAQTGEGIAECELIQWFIKARAHV